MIKVYKLYKLSHILYRYRVPIFPLLIKITIRVLYAAHIPYQAKIGKGTILGDEGFGIAIHPRTVIGEYCVISPNVVFGGTSHKYEVPRVGNRVLIGPGAVVLGPVTIGDNSVVGANAVVLSDVPANSIVGGIPARVLKKDIDIEDYL